MGAAFLFVFVPSFSFLILLLGIIAALPAVHFAAVNSTV